VAIITTTFSTPIGEMIAGATDAGICLLDFRYRKLMPAIQRRITTGLGKTLEEGHHPLFTGLRKELDEYFEGTRQEFTVPVQPIGSDFQLSVWDSLLRIPYGRTVTYMHQAKVHGDEKAIRAVATANGMNSLAIIIPCHRVIGADGSLTGYAGGLTAKRWLLQHERKHAGLELQSSLF
jgi:AraC family transcriptional regulator of adaptative response/methylated-DNA-[protein]-cysteine methyltransferase